MDIRESLTTSTVIEANDSCLSTTIDGEAVILHTDEGMYYGFNEVATYIWNILDDPHTIDELCEKVAGEFDVGYNQCRDDVYEHVTQLLEYRLIHTTE